MTLPNGATLRALLAWIFILSAQPILLSTDAVAGEREASAATTSSPQVLVTPSDSTLSAQTGTLEGGALPGAGAVGPAGTYQYQLPLDLPPGRGPIPALSITYASSAGDGDLGFGWSIQGVPAITLCAQTLAQDYVDMPLILEASDRFCLDGARLVLISGAYGADGATYQLETNPSTKVVSRGSVGHTPSYFEVQTKVGEVLTFGYDGLADTSASASITASITSKGILAWGLSRAKDVWGNKVTYSYAQSACGSANVMPDKGTCRLVLGSVFYNGDYTAGAATVPEVEIRFSYETERTSSLGGYLEGNFRAAGKLLTRIDYLLRGDNRIRYTLRYRTPPVESVTPGVWDYINTTNRIKNALASNRPALLGGITKCGGPALDKCLPETTFEYSNPSKTLGVAVKGTATSTEISATNISGTSTRQFGRLPIAVDLDGDGIGDPVLITPKGNGAGTAVLVLRSSGAPINRDITGFDFNPDQTGGGPNGSLLKSEDLTEFGDVDADGRPDLIVARLIRDGGVGDVKFQYLVSRTNASGGAAGVWSGVAPAVITKTIGSSSTSRLFDGISEKVLHGGSGLRIEIVDYNHDGYNDLFLYQLRCSSSQPCRVDHKVLLNKRGSVGGTVSSTQLDSEGWFVAPEDSAIEGYGSLAAQPLSDDPVFHPSYFALDSRITDVNGDGMLDMLFDGLYLAGFRASDGSVQYHHMGGPPVVFGMSRGGGVIADINGDGLLDAVGPRVTGVINQNHTLTTMPAPSYRYMGVYLSKGDGTFAGSVGYPISTYPAITNPIVSDTRAFSSGVLLLGEMNGDGLVDLVISRADTQEGARVSVAYGLGDGRFTEFTPAGESTGDGWIAKGCVSPSDWCPPGTPSSTVYFPFVRGTKQGSSGLGFVRSYITGSTYQVDRFDVWPTTTSNVPNDVTGVRGRMVSHTDGNGLKTAIAYQPLTGNLYTFDNWSPADADYADMRTPIYVVSSVAAENGAGTGNTKNTTSYAYANGKYSLTGRGFLGFGKVTSTSVAEITGPTGADVSFTKADQSATTTLTTVTESVYQQLFPCTGLLSSGSTTTPARKITVNGHLVSSEAHVFTMADTANAAVACGADTATTAGPKVVHLKDSSSVGIEYNVDTVADQTDERARNETSRQFDAYGNLTSEAATLKAANTSWYMTSKDITYRHANPTAGASYVSAGLTGLVESVRTETKYPNILPRHVQKYWNTYNPTNLYKIDSRTDQAFTLSSSGAQDQPSSYLDYGTVTSYQYDSYGNVTSSTVSGAGVTGLPADSKMAPLAAAKTVETPFDGKAGVGGYPAGLFNTAKRQIIAKYATNLERGTSYTPISTTLVEEQEFDPLTGAVVRDEEVNGAYSIVTLDALGRESLTTGYSNAGVSVGSVTTERKRCADVTTCQGDETVRVAVTRAGETAVYSYLDMLGREVRRVGDAFDGTDVAVVTHYDELGRVRCVSEPGTTGSCDNSFSKWTHTEYDQFGRLARERATWNRWTTYSYSNLQTTIVSPGDATNSTVTRKITVNLRGQPTYISEANGTADKSERWYRYDATGNLLVTEDVDRNYVLKADGSPEYPVDQTVVSYDPLNRKTKIYDPDTGVTSYVYDAFGREIRATDAKGQKAYSWYDELDRMYFREEADLKGYWQYDTFGTNGLGRLFWQQTGSRANPDYKRNFNYDTAGRVSGMVDTIGTGETQRVYRQVPAYDGYGRITSFSYNPYSASGVALTAPDKVGYKNFYNAYGYLYKVTDLTDSAAVLWEAKSQDEAGRLKEFRLGNGLTTRRSYHDPYGLLQTVQTGRDIAGSTDLSQLVQSSSFGYSPRENLISRNRMPENIQETFQYDKLNRLTTTLIDNGTTSVLGNTYDWRGNLLTKTDAGTYSYAAQGGTCGGAHRVCQVSGTTNTQFEYDANGNLLKGNGLGLDQAGVAAPLTWTGFNMPSTIRKGSVTESFVYNADHERVKHTVTDGTKTTTTYYVNPRVDLGGHFEEAFTVVDGTPTKEYTHYIYAGGEVVGSVVTRGTGNSGWAGMPATTPDTYPTTSNPNAAGVTLPTDPAGIFTYYRSGSTVGLTVKYANYTAAAGYSATATGQRRYGADETVTYRARVSHPTDLWNAGQMFSMGVGNSGTGTARRYLLLTQGWAGQTTGLSLYIWNGTSATTIPIADLPDSTTQYNVEIVTGSTLTWVYVYGANGRTREDGFVWSGPIDWAAGNAHTHALEINGSANASASGKSVRITNLGETVGARRYFHTDHLASIEAVTDDNGNVLEQLSYDPWGKRRGLEGDATTARSQLWTHSPLPNGGWDTSQMSWPNSGIMGLGTTGEIVVSTMVFASGGSASTVGTRRYVADDTIAFTAQFSGLASSQYKASLGVTNSGTGSALRTLRVEQNAADISIRVRGLGGNTTEQVIPVSAATPPLYTVEIVTGPQTTSVYVYTGSTRPTTATWSANNLDWSGGAGLARAIEVAGTAPGTYSATDYIALQSISETRIEAASAVKARYTADHGFTGHEHLESLGLIHMNGRLFDPLVARFVSADPTIPSPLSSQSFNRYSYLENSPLRMVDLDGYGPYAPPLAGAFGDGYAAYYETGTTVQLGREFYTGPGLVANGLGAGNLSWVQVSFRASPILPMVSQTQTMADRAALQSVASIASITTEYRARVEVNAGRAGVVGTGPATQSTAANGATSRPTNAPTGGSAPNPAAWDTRAFAALNAAINTPRAMVGPASVLGEKGKADCSGACWAIYKEMGIDYGYTKAGDFPPKGQFRRVRESELQVLDVIQWKKSAGHNFDHLSVYFGKDSAGRVRVGNSSTKAQIFQIQYLDGVSKSEGGPPAAYWRHVESPDL